MSKARFLYTAVLYLLAPLLPLRLLWRARKQPAYLLHWRERFGFYSRPLVRAGDILWIHAVSVGETRAAMPLITALQSQFPQAQILLTHMTPTGRDTGRALAGAGVLQAYLPYDFPGAVRRFLQHYQPRFGLLMETELWPNLIAACSQQGIPLALINARLSARSARRYAWFPSLSREALRRLTCICAQTEADSARLQKLGASSVAVTGNMKFDVSAPSEAGVLRQQWKLTRPVLLAASTREGEEALILEAYLPYANKFLLVLVPRHPQRFEQVAQLLDRSGLQWQRRSANTNIGDSQIILGDSMGEMFAYYAAADVALIGGSLLAFGGQNLIEACVMGVPVVLGPHTENFVQVAEDAISAGAALRVQDASSALRRAADLMEDANQREAMALAGRDFAARHKGAVEKTLRHIQARLVRA